MSSTNISGKRRRTQIKKSFLYCDLRIKQFTLMFVPIIFRKGHCGTMCLLWPKILFIKKIRSKESASQENTSIFIENFPSKVFKWVYKKHISLCINSRSIPMGKKLTSRMTARITTPTRWRTRTSIFRQGVLCMRHALRNGKMASETAELGTLFCLEVYVFYIFYFSI